MKTRSTNEYKNMTPYDACAYVGGFSGNTPTEMQLLAAWQYIYDNQIWRELEGWYGRVLFNGMIPDGLIDNSPLTKKLNRDRI